MNQELSDVTILLRRHTRRHVADNSDEASTEVKQTKKRVNYIQHIP